MFPQSVFPDSAEINSQGHLVIGGCSTLELASESAQAVLVLVQVALVLELAPVELVLALAQELLESPDLSSLE